MSELIDAVNDYDINLVRQLLDQGADIDIRDGKGWTALMHSSTSGNINLVETLLNNGADPNFQDDDEGINALIFNEWFYNIVSFHASKNNKNSK